MKILFTGASSFTGMWFVQELVEQGHEVITTFQQPLLSYSGTRKERVKRAMAISNPVFECSFGSDSFIKLIQKQISIDLLCHHAADVTDYKSPLFNPLKALNNNTHNLKAVLDALNEKGCRKVILTGSVFEQKEGEGSDDHAVSPYGLSKGLSSEVFRYYCARAGMTLGKFVIPNPFGPYEESRFTSFLVKAWFNNETPPIDYPAYVRDNIHVSLLAKAYEHFASELKLDGCFYKINPSGYSESQKAFTMRFANELAHRLKIPCEVNFRDQVLFTEPKVRINTDVLDVKKLGWQENRAWDQLAAYYEELYSK